VALAGLAMAPPRCYSAELAEPMVDEAIAVARTAAGGATALRVSLESKLYLRGGPAHRDEARALAIEVQRLASQHRRVMPVVPITLALHEALVALQRGELAVAGASLDEAVVRSRELRHGELLWHATRARALLSMQQGGVTDAATELRALHLRAEHRPILGTAAYCAFDRVVALPELTGQALPAPIDAATHKALESDGSEQPSVWSLQVRALAAAGLLGEARAALRGVAPADLVKLPCDTSYLGTLGNLARAALRLNELEHAEALYELLARHPGEFAVHESLVCEGAVPQLLGLLARALGRQAEARTQLEIGLAMNERAGLQLRATEARAALAELGPASRRG
jgi:tetratricopeptide (TPR) repeat protein